MCHIFVLLDWFLTCTLVQLCTEQGPSHRSDYAVEVIHLDSPSATWGAETISWGDIKVYQETIDVFTLLHL
jgi:hypothetical protein